MVTKSRSLLPACLFAIALSCLVSMPKTCVAQVAPSTHPLTRTSTPSPGSSSTSPVQETEAGVADPTVPQSTSHTGSSQTGAAGLASRVKAFNRNAPTRENWNTIDLGTNSG